MHPEIARIQSMLDGEGYVADEALATSVYLAIQLRKPLLIEGGAGVGKTEVAKVMAAALETDRIRLQCYEGLDATTSLYEWNYQRQLLHIRMMEHSDLPLEVKEREIFSEPFLLRRPLLQAITHHRAPVLLIDECDRADEEWEAFLLEVLSDWQVTIPEIGTIKAQHIPYVVLTSNRTRELGDALRRRCLYLWIDYPTFEKELAIVRRKVPGVNGQLAGQKGAGDALRGPAAVDVSNRRECYLALRTVLTSRYDDLAVFDEVFREFWNPPAPQPTGADQPQPDLPALASDGQTPSLLSWLDEALQSQGEESIPAYSPVELLTQKDFSTFTGNDLDEVSRLVVAIARRVATRLSRRVRAVRRGHALDLRRTIRHSLRRGGVIVELAYRKRRIQKTRVVLLADVSGSKDLYSRFLIQFIFALQHALGQVETLVFSTTLTRVTEALSESDLRAALDQVARTVPDWSGGTKIGQSLRAFLTRYGGLVLTPRTVVIVISDGWDTGDIDVLDDAMRELHARAGRVIWLNPLLGSPGYEPICQGMRVALPYVDVFASAHNLESLRQLERHLALKRR